MDGIHDLGGMHGFGRVTRAADERPFHSPWEGRVFAMANLCVAAGLASVDALRAALERLDPVTYLTAGYYGRWRRALEALVGGADAAPHVPGLPTARRTLDRPPRFAPGDVVRTRAVPSAGHTRLPRYARGHRGTVTAWHGAWVYPPSNAHGRGDDPQHVYTVRFDGRALFGDAGEPGVLVHLDCFEPDLTGAPP